MISMLLSDGAVYAQISSYVHDGDAWGLSWFLSKHILGEVAHNPSFRAAFAAATGLALTDGALSKLLSWVAMPIKATLMYNSVTSVMKTAMALSTSDLKTTFAVWQDVVNYGSVHGQVAEATFGNPISGATVTLTGDDNNPLSPSHQVVTGSDGHYSFHSIGVGPKTITATKSGYTTQSVSVTIAKDQDIEQHIVMTQATAGVSGRVLNGVLVHHGVSPATFRHDVSLVAYPIGASGDDRSATAVNGAYAWSLTSGTWRIRASYDGYHSDSLDVTVPQSGAVTASRDLVLQPNPTMEGNIYIDMNNDGTYERDYHIEFQTVGLNEAMNQACASGGSGSPVLGANAVEGSTNYNYDNVQIGFSANAITGEGVYPVGPLYTFGCASSNNKAIVNFITGEEWCSDSYGNQGYMFFTFDGDPDGVPCDCGITAPGTMYITDWGTQLGDLVAGGLTVELAGWANCYCGTSDDNGDGIDDWDVDCARARLNLDFKMPVGTGYLAGASPHFSAPTAPRPPLLGETTPGK